MLVVLWLQSLLQDMESRRPRLEAVVSAGEQLQQRVDSETERDALRQQGESGTDRWSHSVSSVVTLCVFGGHTLCLLVVTLCVFGGHTLCLWWPHSVSLVVTLCVLLATLSVFGSHTLSSVVTLSVFGGHTLCLLVVTLCVFWWSHSVSSGGHTVFWWCPLLVTMCLLLVTVCVYW